jgi:hypothetical protein
MPGLVPGIHVLASPWEVKTWMAGTKPGHDESFSVSAILLLDMQPFGCQVVFNIEPHGSLVKLTLTHEGFAEGSELLDGVSKGWPAILSGLKTMLESGTALAIPLSALGKVHHA